MPGVPEDAGSVPEAAAAGAGDTVHKLGDQKPQTHPAQECSLEEVQAEISSSFLAVLHDQESCFFIVFKSSL